MSKKWIFLTILLIIKFFFLFLEDDDSESNDYGHGQPEYTAVSNNRRHAGRARRRYNWVDKEYHDIRRSSANMTWGLSLRGGFIVAWTRAINQYSSQIYVHNQRNEKLNLYLEAQKYNQIFAKLSL